MSAELPKSYEFTSVQAEITEIWDAERCWHAEPDTSKKPFVIVIPPPNVTAALHLGHALNNTIQDILVRWRRMCGDNAVWIPGTDHAGIATQTVVDKRLAAEGQMTLKDYKILESEGKGGREQFVAKVQSWKDEYEAKILSQLKAMGCSCDWDRTAFTMDEKRSHAVREAFFRLFKDGLIYRGKRLVNWDPATQTALADDEVEMEEIDGHFYYLKYPLADGSGTITVATTRPETMLGDTAVAVNPKDPRAASLRGKSVRLPIVGREIPIIEDDYVVLPVEHGGDENDPKARFSSGFLKVTPAHDPNDYLLGDKYNLPRINVMAPDATISKDHGWTDFESSRDSEGADFAFIESLLGHSREEARQRIVEYFKSKGLLEKVVPYRHSVGHSYRSHVPIEPYLSDQWYISVRKPIERLAATVGTGNLPGTEIPRNSLAGLALSALAESHRGDAATQSSTSPDSRGLKFVPDRYAKTYETWNAGLKDWCISRQLWWGHRIPVWKVGHEYSIEATDTAEQDPDVLDTWFSSALWPMSTLGWPEKTPELAAWNPTSVLCTAREIITLWVSRMVMFNRYFMAEHGTEGTGTEEPGETSSHSPSPLHLPFHDVFVHAMIQDGHGQKMSKSLGNGVDPLDIIETHGADAMRFTLCQMTTHTQDVRMSVDIIDPHTGETFEPQFITNAAGYTVAAPIQEYKGRKCVSTYGLSVGTKPTAEMPAAKNTSSKFDLGRNFCNKLWNASRFVLMQIANQPQPPDDFQTLEANWSVIDRWILSRLARTVQACNEALAAYRFDQYARACYDFVWRDFCDWYLEASKPAMRDEKRRPHTANILATCLDVMLRLMHPVIPFVTEKLWATLRETNALRGIPNRIPSSNAKRIMLADYPQFDAAMDTLTSTGAERVVERLQEIIAAIRIVRNEQKVDPKKRVPVSIACEANVMHHITANAEFIETMAVCTLKAVGPDVPEPAGAAKTTGAGCSIYVEGVIDAAASEKRKADLMRTIGALKGRLSNQSYISKAPPHLVEQTKQQLAEAEAELAKLS